MKVLRAKSKWFQESDLRLDAEFHLSEGPVSKRLIDKSPFELKPLHRVTERIFLGKIFRRTFVAKSEQGIPYITASDMVTFEASSGKFLSKKFTSQQSELLLEPGWILVSCSGTLGNTVFTGEGFRGKIGTHDLIRIVPKATEMAPGFLYAFLASKYGYSLLVQPSYGGVVKHIEPHHIKNLLIPNFPKAVQKKIHELVMTATDYRHAANEMIEDSKRKLLHAAQLKPLSLDDFEYFGSHSNERKLSVFTISSKSLSSISLNAFNHSERIKRLVRKIKKSCETISLSDAITEDGFFNTGSFPRLEVNSPRSIKLINQGDIFNVKIKGKLIARKSVKTNNLVKYGEVLIAGVGTLGENETFCKVVFANEELEGQLVSGEFIRMNSRPEIPSGYLFAWLSSDYGFRLIRSTHSGTKLCRPIHTLLYDIPVPVVDRRKMKEIHNLVISAQSKKHQALLIENQAISIVEKEIRSWQK